MEECDCDECCGLCVGPQGFLGVQGSSTTGPQGPIGMQGTISIGAQGMEGYQGPGVQGLQGFPGSQGSPDEFQPRDGNTGERGYQGDVDEQGPQGFRGNVGFQGMDGSNQNTGPRGYQGPFVNGAQGSQGPIGLRTAGAQGPIGFQGPPWQSQQTENTSAAQYSAVTLTVPPSTTFIIPRPAYVRVTLHIRIDDPSAYFNFGIYDSALTQIGPSFRMTGNGQQRQVLVIARNVPAGTYGVGFVSNSLSAFLTLFDFSAVTLYT